MARGYQAHEFFADLQNENKHLACHIKAKTTRLSESEPGESE